MTAPTALPIAIAIRAPEAGAEPLDARVDPHFGRAAALLFVDPDGSAAEVVSNGHAADAHGAGSGLAGTLAARGVRTAIAADFGPNAYRALTAARIAIWKVAAGTPVRDCLRGLREGTLSPMKMDVYS
jgi:predicted Fe-Mo cluster-binding NifX family protein